MMFIQTVIANALGAIVGVLAADLYTRYVSSIGRHLKPRSVLLIFLGTFLAIVATDLTVVPVGETIRAAMFGPPSQNERWTLEAWRAFDDRDYVAAITAAQKVIDEYSGTAQRQQQELESRNQPRPPVGKVSSLESGEIFSRGLLNDVAACYWIQGQSYERTGRVDEARAAYALAARLTYGRTWDPQWWPLRGWSPFGWFWSPSDVSGDRLSQLAT